MVGASTPAAVASALSAAAHGGVGHSAFGSSAVTRGKSMNPRRKFKATALTIIKFHVKAKGTLNG
jgi:hypothetical protein